MSNITLRQLRYFYAVAHHRHFGRAADACAVSQPALSVQIKELEANLGAPLFDRGARNIGLTRFGEEFLPRAAAILRSVDELADLARASQDRLVGRLRLGVIPTIAPYLLPRLIPAVSAINAGIDLNIRETQTQRLLAELNEGKLDAAIVALPVSEPGLIEVPLFSEDFVLIRPSTDVGRPVPAADELRTMRLLLLEEGHCFRDQALSFCNMQPGFPRDGLDGSSLTTLVQMVASGMGVTLIPEMAVSVETRATNVLVDHFATPRPNRTIGMIWRQSSPLGNHLSQLAEVVGREGRALIAADSR